MGIRRQMIAGLLLALVALSAGVLASHRSARHADGAPTRLPGDDIIAGQSFWTQHHQRDPVSPNSAMYISALKRLVCAHSSNACHVQLAGTKGDAWGAPVYDSTDLDTMQTVRCSDPDQNCYGFPESHLTQLRLPPDIGSTYPTYAPSNDTDSEMAIIDRHPDAGYVVWLHRACPPGPFGDAFCAKNGESQWTANGMSVHYLDSNLLDGCWPKSYPKDFPTSPRGNSDTRNTGHRGLPGLYAGVQWQETVQVGIIRHVMKIAIPETADGHFFPYDSHEFGNGTIPEGSLIRIKGNIDLTDPRYRLHGPALVIARALQQYGAVIGDRSGDSEAATLKTENLLVEGRTQEWSVVGIETDSLAAIPLDSYEFVAGGYSGPHSGDPDPYKGGCGELPPEPLAKGAGGDGGG